jgi:MoxR-like ATPase
MIIAISYFSISFCAFVYLCLNKKTMLDVTLESIRGLLFEQGYITDHSIEMALFLSLKLQKPLLIEGPAGVGKTEIAKVMTQILETELIRLQCYEGLDASQALYEWNYQRQLLHLKASEESGLVWRKKKKGYLMKSSC